MSCPCLDIGRPRQVTHSPPVSDILLLLARTPDRRNQRLQPRDTGNVG